MKCPVCPNPDVGSATRCGTCGADLSSILTLQELPARWFNEALELIAAGAHDAAIGKLEAAIAAGGSAPEMRRVLGKALWNAGRAAEAKAQWQLLPQDDEARRLLAMESPAPRSPASPLMLVSVGIAGVLLGAFAALLMTRTARPPQEPAPVAAAAAVTIPVVKRSEDPPRPAGTLEPLARRLEDVTTSWREGSLEIRFPEGLFPSGSNAPTRDGARRLRALAGALASHSGRLRVTVTGFTDPKPPPQERWKDNWTLAYARANVAIQIMDGPLARPSMMGRKVIWTAESSGDRNTPFPNDTEENRARNRTVVIRVTESDW